jgi:hypothetical protein
MAGGQLGIGDYSAYLMTRGLTEIIGELVWTGLTWERRYLDTSQATVSLDAAGVQQCCGLLEQARPWATEIMIIRGEDGRVWSGPVMQRKPSNGDTGVDIVANDLSAWATKRLIHRSHLHTTPKQRPIELSLLLNELWTDAVEVENGMGWVLAYGSTGIEEEYTVHNYDRKKLRDAMDDLAKLGLDWTTIDRVTLGGSACRGVVPITTLSDDAFFSIPGSTSDGAAMANTRWLLGAGSDKQQIQAEAVGDPGDYGLLEEVDSDSDVEKQKQADRLAQTNLTANLVPVELLTGGQLAPSAPVDISSLIPGAIITIPVTTCGAAAGDYRLTQVAASVGASEQLTISVEPPLAVAT